MRKQPLNRFHRASSPVFVLLAILAGTSVPSIVRAGSGDPSMSGIPAVAQREIARREQMRQNALSIAEDGDKLMKQKEYAAAVDKYRAAMDALPLAPMTDEIREDIGHRFGEAGVARAHQLADEGNYAAAQKLLDEVLLPQFDETNSAARTLRARLDDPDRYPPTRTPEYTERVRAVEKGLARGESEYLLGNYDAAETEFNNVLTVDRYNTAARSFMEKIERTKMDYYGVAYNHTRARMLRMVDEKWETPPPLTIAGDETGGTPRPPESDLRAINTRKLKEIIIPNVNFESTTLGEAVEYLRIQSKDNDKKETDPTRKGLNILIRSGGGAEGAGDASEKTIPQLVLRNVPVGEVLKYLCENTKMRVKVEEYAVVLVPMTETDVELYTRAFRVPPDFIPTTAEAGDGGGGAATDPFATTTGAAAGSTLRPRPKAKEYLESLGVPFPPNATANFDPRTSTLTVRNTPQAMELIETIVQESINRAPKQVNIESKFVEVAQRNGKELGFDWLLGAGSLNDKRGVYISGGNAGNGIAVDSANYPIIDPTTTGDGTLPLGQNPVTAGNRSGDYAITRNAIDSILNTSIADVGSDAVAPGVLAISGLLTEPQFQVVLRALDQKKGTDLLSAPSVTTRSGLPAKIEIIREFIYPTEYDPPELPNQVGSNYGGGNNNGGGTGGLGQVSSFPVTPATPTAFEMKPVGVSMEVDPTVAATGSSIDLNLQPEVVEFEGFINYGNPITSPAIDGLGRATQVVITENLIQMPVFSTGRVKTQVTVYDGATVAIGGMIREDVQDVEDKVPILGDMPLVGRLFKTTSENHYKRNLMVFVTAHLIDPSGKPVRTESKPLTAPETITTSPGGPAPLGGAILEGGDGLPTLTPP